jgi:hypothetical protein
MAKEGTGIPPGLHGNQGINLIFWIIPLFFSYLIYLSEDLVIT